MRYVAILLLCCLAGFAELRTIPMAQASVEGALDPASAVWKPVSPVPLALQRTPLLYPTDQPAALEIQAVEIRMLRGAGKTYVRLEWQDPSRETAALPKAERAWQTEQLVKQSDATNRFSDACAVMTPANSGDVFPSLQMGDAAHPVRIYFWDSSRGAAVMEATGRETTRRTGATFQARAAWVSAKWSAVLELPELAPGTPVAVAIWNGGQQDRDGRKYFSIWYKTQ